ncbi:MAG: UvrD-helicase domain-containing protein, partial [Lachnospiraceae bacterium]|nr:UvrD-helicase domain-containing protein [Lachnospiraceae bacterium]
LTEEVCGLDIYTPTIEADLLVIEDISGSEDISELMRRLREVAFVRFGTGGRKGEPKPEEADKKQLQESRDALREQVKQLRERAARFDIAENRRLTADCIPVVSELVALTRQFAVCFSQKKRDAGVIDYGDMEHLAIRVLRINDGSVAGEYRELYEEIYVDEYQDSNMVQETILKAVARGNNLFMVGDVKQSIYGFRLARPDIFIQKYESYKSGEQGERIDLNRNFRSRTEVLNAVNEVFSAIMKKDSAGIEYNKEAELIPGAEGYEERTEEPSPDRTELLLIQREESSVNEKELEAEVISERIQELVLGYCVKDSNTGGTRKAQYKDIVILLRTAREWAETFSRVLQKNGIPVMITSRTGYFAAYEVAHLLDYLKVIDNPRQDIPLASALLGAFGKMTDGELASLRGQYKTDSLYDTVVQAADTNQKAEEFLSRLNYYRSKMGHTGVYELLQEIIETGYGRYVAAMENGRQRLANVNMLLQKAEDYGKTSYKGLFQFVRYIDMLKKYEVDYGESQIAEGDDAVRIMTIHNSKGLEFPVCFLAGLGKTYNFTDQRVGTILDAEYGIGMDRVDIERRTKAPVILKEAIIRKGLKELRAEEMRLLYVAMTRAKEKLILTGSVKDPEKTLNSYTGLSNTASFLELFVYANRIKPLREISIIPYTLKGIVQRGVETELNRNEAYLRLLEISEGKADYLNGDAADEELSDMVSSLRERLAFQYSEAEDEESPQKFSVTELKQRHLEQLLKENPEEGGETEELFPPPPEKEKYVPKFIRGVQTKAKTVSGNLHGSAVHRLFELWNYRVEASPESIQSFLRDSADRGRIEQELIDTVSERELLNFFQSDLAKRMQRADQEGKLYREQPFVIRLDGQLIQGIIDAFFIEEGEIVVVDYKTDRVNESTELVKRYELQLEYYARALQRLLGIPVKERIIYSTVLNQSILV